MNDKSVKRTAVIVSAIFLCILLVSVFFLVLHMGGKEPGKDQRLIANVYQEGNLIMKIPLEEGTKTYRIDNEDGSYNILEVKNRGIKVIEADCPDHLCYKVKCNSSESLPIVCLPNRIVIHVTDEKEKGKDSIDAVVY